MSTDSNEDRPARRRQQPPRVAPSFTKFSMPRIANQRPLPNLREIFAANPLRIEP